MKYCTGLQLHFEERKLWCV